MKTACRVLLPFLLFASSCSLKDDDLPDSISVQNVVTHYFTTKAKVNTSLQPSFLTGDFNGDGIQDLAVLFLPAQVPTASGQVQLSTPWAFPGSKQLENYQTSLAIVSGSGSGWLSANTKVYVMLDKSGSLQTPSFQLRVARKGDKKYAELQSALPVKHNGDLLVLPTEAGIDTAIYWDKTNYKLHIPNEIP